MIHLCLGIVIEEVYSYMAIIAAKEAIQTVDRWLKKHGPNVGERGRRHIALFAHHVDLESHEAKVRSVVFSTDHPTQVMDVQVSKRKVRGYTAKKFRAI